MVLGKFLKTIDGKRYIFMHVTLAVFGEYQYIQLFPMDIVLPATGFLALGH